MRQSLVIAVRLYDGRYHGEGDGFNGTEGWPPSPARLFQALVAGVARGRLIDPDDQRALHWLEGLPAPQIAAPPAKRGGTVPHFVPNNDLDAKGGDPGRVAEIRVGKSWRPYFFNASHPIVYVWHLESHLPDEAKRVCAIANCLYQLGRGIDMAAATATITSAERAHALLAAHPGITRTPAPAGGGNVPVATLGTLASLMERRHRGRERLTRSDDGNLLFTQPPKAVFRHIGYDTPATRLHFEVRNQGAFAPYPLSSAATFTIGLRDAVAEKLQRGLQGRTAEIERLVIGRGAGPRDVAQRIRITPVPSIGMEHTDPSIRRVMVEVPPECPLSSRDIGWAFADAQPLNHAGRLLSTTDATMAERYLRPARTFRSITALALTGARRDKPRRSAGKDAPQRNREEALARAALVQALRHVGIAEVPEHIHVQREPLHRRGVPAERFAAGTRFSARTMWHAEIRFRTPIAGPLVVGDGRFFGLGLLQPVVEYDDVLGFQIPANRVRDDRFHELVHALRRALMSRARDGDSGVPRLFSGHENDGKPDGSSGGHNHVFIAADASDGWITRLVVAAPWAGDRSLRSRPHQQRIFTDTVNSLDTLRAGRLGAFPMRAVALEDGDPSIGPARHWRTERPYFATRNLKKKDDLETSVAADVQRQCQRLGLPTPERIDVLSASVGPRGGWPTATLEMHFAAAVRGPLLLGRDSHRGGGMFRSCDEHGA